MVPSQASGGSKFGRALFPLLLVLLPISAESAFVRCASGTCGSSTSITQTNSVDEMPTPDQKLEFPYPLNGTFAGSGSSGLSLGIDGSEEEAESVTEAESTESQGVSTKKAPVAATQTQTEPQAQTHAPANTTPSIPQVGPATTGERATRNYRTYETPAPRRIYDHPSAGGAGATSSVPAPAAGGQSSRSTSSTPSSPAPPPPPPPPPPGQGSPGGFEAGEPGELAGFIG